MDEAGDDRYDATGASLGFAQLGALGLALERAGDDAYATTSDTLGAARGTTATPAPPATGLFCDLGGRDAYLSDSEAAAGFVFRPNARGWFVDMGGDPDAYRIPFGHPAADGRAWTRGLLGGLGHGQDV